MTVSKNTPHPYLVWAFIFICGFITGVGITVYKMQPLADTQKAVSTAQAPDIDHEALHKLEEQVKKTPEDFATWVALGHMYFDSNQPQKAIEAYETALKLQTGDANLWTDLGVMYRRTEHPQKAIECFDKAIALDAKHQPSRFNKGIVLLYDLNEPQKALASFEQILAINPDAQSGNGGSIREFVEHMKTELAKAPPKK